MSINVNTILPPQTILQQVVTAVNASANELSTRSVVLDPTGLLLSYKTINKSFGAISFNGNVTSTPITTAGIFYLVSNSSYVLNSLSNKFSLTSSGITGAASSRLTYNGAAACPFHISSSVTYLCAGSNNQNIVTQLSQNGVLIPTTKATSALAAANLSQCNNMIAVVNLNPNDYIECQVANLTASNNVSITDIIISILSLQ